MDDSNRSLFNILRIGGPVLFFVVVFAVLYKFTDLGIYISLAIAAIIAVVDFWTLTWLMTRLGKTD